jgi:hypothetical protein
MSKEKEIVLLFRDILTRTNEMADAAEKTPMDIEFIRAERKTYLEHYEENKALLALPASEVTTNFMFKAVYKGFAETMTQLLTLVGLYYKNLDLLHDNPEDAEKLKETVSELGNFRNECNKRFKKVEAQMSAIGKVD